MVQPLILVVGDNIIKLWDSQDGKIIKSLEEHTGRVISVVFSSDGATNCF